MPSPPAAIVEHRGRYWGLGEQRGAACAPAQPGAACDRRFRTVTEEYQRRNNPDCVAEMRASLGLS